MLEGIFAAILITVLFVVPVGIALMYAFAERDERP